VVVAGSNQSSNDGSANTGRYRIKGWVLDIQRDNGQVERRLLTFPNNSGREWMDMNGLPYRATTR
jgi:hypothetical protein